MSLRRAASVMIALLALSACVPSSYLGVSTRAQLSEDEQKLLTVARKLTPYVKDARCTDPVEGQPILCRLQPLSPLAREAAQGNKHAQLELGKRFERGWGLDRDLPKARELYKRASTRTGGPVHTCIWDEYQKRCNPMTIDLPYDYGLPEASLRLERLEARTAPETAPGE